MDKSIYPWIIKIRQWLSLSEWSRHIIGLQAHPETKIPGLVMVQIDGLGRTVFERALAEGYMPFMKKLLDEEHYHLHSFYSGLPSSTPSVQGELFYGVKSAVPSFSFFDSENQRVFSMYRPEDARVIEQRLAVSEGLLAGGSSYSNIYAGGCTEPHFCAVSLGLNKLWLNLHPIKFILFIFNNVFNFLRLAVSLVVELVCSLFDCAAGILKGKGVKEEFKFIFIRLGLCVLLRDLITMGVKIDVARGMPIIHLNYLGYDEHSHRRGPVSSFALKSLKAVDRKIAAIYRMALKTTRRNYDVWVYSDHGQQKVDSYHDLHGRTVKEAVDEIFEEDELHKADMGMHSVLSQRTNLLGLKQKTLEQSAVEMEKVDQGLVVTASGPLGHIYLSRELSDEELEKYAQKLVNKGHIPFVFYKNKDQNIMIVNEEGVFAFKDHEERVFGRKHPFYEEVRADFEQLMQHKNIGTFLISGWKPNGRPVSFPKERGAHAGMGNLETEGFALFPKDIVSFDEGEKALRASTLREYALEFIGRKEPEVHANWSERSESGPKKDTVRIMTYNIHSCMGMDGKVTAERIARAIARHEPDVVALQEVDMSRIRSGQVDQPHLIAEKLKMLYHFHPNIMVEEEKYGNAVFSRFPMTLKRADKIATLKHKPKIEPRGAIWVDIEWSPGKHLQLINTHLGLRKEERWRQAQDLLGEGWLGSSDCQGPAILLGDFNDHPDSAVCRKVKEYYKDAQDDLECHIPKNTWFSHLPLRRIDHIFVSGNIDVIQVVVSRAYIDRVASDHLPLIVDIKINSEHV